MMKKKLLVFHPALAPYRIDFFNSLNEEFDATFYFFNDNLLNQKFDQEELKRNIHFKCKYLKTGINTPGRSFRFGITKILNTTQPDIVFCPEYNLINISVIAHRWIFRKRFTVYSICDDNVQVASEVPFVKKTLRKFLLNFLDGIILTHHEIRNWYHRELNSGIKLLVFPIIRREHEYFRSLKKSLSLVNQYKKEHKLFGKKTFLFVGRLVKVKNLDNLLEAFKIVRQTNNEAVLLIVGSGDQENALKDKINDLDLSKGVKLLGRYEGDKLIAWYTASDIFILPSTSETFGAVINEALLAGCYSLVSKKAGGSSLIEENYNGNLFDPYNINEIVNLINSTLENDKLFTDKNVPKNSRMLISYDDAFSELMTQIK